MCLILSIVIRACVLAWVMANPPPAAGTGAPTDDQQSPSPRKRRPSPSPARRGGCPCRYDKSVALMWMVMEVSGQFPLLTKINYTDWSSMMRVMLHAHGLWTTVKEGTTDEVKDQMAMEALLRVVPLEMTSSLVSKPFVKAAWDLLESARLGYDRARMSSVHHVRWQYENVSFLDGESLDDFALCLGKMVHELEILGDPEESRKVAAKYLCIVPKKFVPVIVSIESLLDTTTMSIEKITSQLWVVEGCSDDEDTDPPTSAGGKLLLTEEKWQACMKEK
jgi:hypothetical protein